MDYKSVLERVSKVVDEVDIRFVEDDTYANMSEDESKEKLREIFEYLLTDDSYDRGTVLEKFSISKKELFSVISYDFFTENMLLDEVIYVLNYNDRDWWRNLDFNAFYYILKYAELDNKETEIDENAEKFKYVYNNKTHEFEGVFILGTLIYTGEEFLELMVENWNNYFTDDHIWENFISHVYIIFIMNKNKIYKKKIAEFELYVLDNETKKVLKEDNLDYSIKEFLINI